MDTKTHRRGPADTSKGRLAKVLLVSLLMHVPFTPWAALVGLLSLWTPPDEVSNSPPITGIPIDIVSDVAPPASAPEQPTGEPDTASPDQPAAIQPVKKPIVPQPSDAGAPDAEADAAAAGAGNASLDAEPPAGSGARLADDAGANADGGAKPLSDPSVVAGVKRVADPNANVRITIYTDKIRTNPLGKKIGPLLGSLYQWRDFFGPSGVDPIRDIDQIYIVGPQLRDSSNVVAVLRHHLSPAKMHAALDLLVRADRAGGEWLDAGVPVASAHADGAERRFVLANPETLVVTPPSAYAAAVAGGKLLHLMPSKGPEAALIYLVTPWRAFQGFPIKVPDSIQWARVRITPTPDGGATAEVEAQDADDETASKDAAYLTRTADAFSQLSLGFLGSILGQQTHRFIEHIAFTSEGSMIHGTASITAAQLQTALDMAGALLTDRATRQVRPVASGGG